jgi:hypothetical protein
MSRSGKRGFGRAIGAVGVLLALFGWTSGAQAGDSARAVLRDAGGRRSVWSI